LDKRVRPTSSTRRTARAAGESDADPEKLSSRAVRVCDEESAASASTPPPQIANLKHSVSRGREKGATGVRGIWGPDTLDCTRSCFIGGPLPSPALGEGLEFGVGSR